MKKLLGMFLIILISCCPSHQLQEPIKIISKETSHMSVGVVEAQVEDRTIGAGTVFAYNKDFLLTAKHVCENMLKAQIFEKADMDIVTYDDKGKRYNNYDAEIYDMSEYSDVCIIKAPNHGLVPAIITPVYRDVSSRDDVSVIGAPLGLAIGIFEGHVMNPKVRHLDGFFYNKLLISAPITHGISGSPVFDDNGFVIGIVVAVSPLFSRVSICETAETVLLAIGDMIHD